MKRLLAAWRDADDLKSRVNLAANDDDAPKKRPALFNKYAPRAPAPATELAVPAVVYSSSSSDGSVVQTPEPDDDLRNTASSTPRWSWMKPKLSKSKVTHVAAVWDPPRQPHLPTTTQPESDDESDHYDEDPEPDPGPALKNKPKLMSTPAPPSPSPLRTSRVLQPATVLRAHINLRAITLAALLPPASPPPLLHLPAAPLFPRSTNHSHKLPRLQDTRSTLIRTVLLRRLESNTLSSVENESIAQFGNRPRRTVPKARPSRLQGIDEEAVSDVNKKVRFYSRGLQTWIDRPCFEDRCVLWTWDPHGREITMRAIVGSGRAVALLEFSEGIEALAGYGVDAPSLLTPAPKNSPKLAPVLDPLRISSSNSQNEAISPASSTPNASTGPSTPTNIPLPVTPVRRKILRFVPEPEPEDEHDNVPLGQQIRFKRHFEELERQAARQAEEQSRGEERMRRVLAEEVKAARARREGARSGVLREAESERVKDRRASYARPAYDPAPSPRRMASEPDTRVRERPASFSRPSSIVEAKSRPASIRSVRTDISRGGSQLQPKQPPLPPHLPRSSTMQTVEDEKRRRRASAVSESAVSVSTSVRHRSAPPLPLMGAPMTPPVPPMPMMPIYPAMPGTPQFFYMQQAQAQAHAQMHAHMQMQMQMRMPLQPPVRPVLPATRSLEGLNAPRPHQAPRHASNDSSQRRTSALATSSSRGPRQ